MAALLVLYNPNPNPGVKASTEAIFIMLPLLCSCMCGKTKFDNAHGAFTFTSIILSKIAGSTSSIGPKTGLIAALFTKISMRSRSLIV